MFRLAGEPGGPLLVVTSGANRVDTERVGAVVGAGLERADAAFVREHSGFAIGGVPPFGWTGATPLVPTLVDEDLLAHDEVWAAAGTPTRGLPAHARRSSSSARPGVSSASAPRPRDA